MTPQDAKRVAELKAQQMELAISVMERPPMDLCQVHMQSGKYLGLQSAIDLIEKADEPEEEK